MGSAATCTICRSRESVAWLLSKRGYDLHRCPACNHIFVHPVPSPDELARIYSFDAGYQVQSDVDWSARTEFAPKFVENLDQIRAHVSEGSLLDVGCSTGEFLHVARERGFAVKGVELNEDTAAIAKSNDLDIFVGRLEEAGFPAGSFDAVYMGDVIEHVVEPGGLLESVRELLKPQGVVLIRTPNHDAFFPRVTYLLYRTLRIPWSHPTPPHHLSQFSIRSLTRCLEHNGFTVKEARYSPCSLGYELRATGVPSRLKQLVGDRRWVAAAGNAILAALVGVIYSAVWVADRALVFKSRDYAMSVIAAPRSSS